MELIAVPFLLAVYFLPTVIAFRRDHAQCDGLFLGNLFFGWTGLGWLVLMGWAVIGKPARDGLD